MNRVRALSPHIGARRLEGRPVIVWRARVEDGAFVPGRGAAGGEAPHELRRVPAGPAMTWWYAVIEAKHELQNPTSAEKIRLLGRAARPRADVARPRHRVRQGRARHGSSPASSAAGSRASSVRRSSSRWPRANAPARSDRGRRGRRQGLPDRAGIRRGALHRCVVRVRRARSDARGARAGGAAASRSASPTGASGRFRAGFELEEGEDFLTLPETVARIESTGVEVVNLIAASQDDWDRYESLHWLALAEWLEANPDAPRGRGVP